MVMTKIRKSISIVVLSIFWMGTHAQNSCEGSEKKLLELFKILNDGNNKSGKHEDYVKLKLADSLIYEEFSSILLDSNSISYPFDSLKSYITNVVSSDKKLHFISWNTMMGGTMDNCSVLAQYIGIDGKIHVQNAKMKHGDMYPDQAVYFYSTVQFQPNHYLAFGHGKYGSKDMAYAIYNFKIESTELIDTNRIFYGDNDGNKTFYNRYDFFKPYSRKDLEPVFDTKSKTICYAEQNDDIKPIKHFKGKNICFIYDGKVFRRKK
jgi:hypothetical protein